MDNTRGSLYMVLAMAAFALEDMFVRLSSTTLPAGEVLLLFGIGGMTIFIILTLRRGEKIFHKAILSRPLLIRMACEAIGRVFFTLALMLTPISSASAILQATPLVVVMGAVIFFGEKIGWRRWTAILFGFMGVLLIIKPGLSGFDPLSILALIGMLGFAGRDLATRAATPELSNIQLSVYGFFILIPTGLAMLFYTGGAVVPDALSTVYIMGTITFGSLAYYALTVAMRTGDISIVTPFRYTRMVFALAVGVIVFAERPDWITLLGVTIIISGGIYTLLRNRQEKLAK